VRWRCWLSRLPLESQQSMWQTSKWHTDPSETLKSTL